MNKHPVNILMYSGNMDLIPFDVFHSIMSYLNSGDVISFILSGMCPEKTVHYSQKRKWVFAKCYSFHTRHYMDFFSKPAVMNSVKIMDLSHCYWLSPETLVSCLVNLKYLEELQIHDTQVSLTHTAPIFANCPHLVKLSINIPEISWDDNAHPSIIKEGLQKLTTLKLCFSGSNPSTWSRLFEILGFCSSCVDLHLDAAFDTPLKKRISQAISIMLSFAVENYFPKMDWMKNLRRFVYTKNQVILRKTEKPPEDKAIITLYTYIIELEPAELKDIWIVPYTTAGHEQPKKCCQVFDSSNALTHLRIFNSRLSSISSISLKYVQATYKSLKELDQFCLKFKKIEQLVVDIIRGDRETFVFGDWSLIHLKYLVVTNVEPDILLKFSSSCPKLKELHIQFPIRKTNRFIHFDNLDRISQFHNLKKLSLTDVSLTAIQSSFITEVLKNCRALESLHLDISERTDCNESNFHQVLCASLPVAKNLIDFRYSRKIFADELVFELMLALELMPRLERIVILQKQCYSLRAYKSMEDRGTFPDILQKLVHKLERLIMLCVSCPIIDSTNAPKLIEFLRETIVPIRPAFNSYIGFRARFPAEGSIVPGIHLNEVIIGFVPSPSEVTPPFLR